MPVLRLDFYLAGAHVSWLLAKWKNSRGGSEGNLEYVPAGVMACRKDEKVITVFFLRAFEGLDCRMEVQRERETFGDRNL